MGQFDGDRAVCGRHGHICSVSRVGVQPWRRRAAAVSMLRIQVIYFASATMFFFRGVMFVPHYYLPIYFQAVKTNTQLMSGLHILPTMVSQVILAMSSMTLSKFLPFLLQRRTPGSSKHILTHTMLPSTVQKLGYHLPWFLSRNALTTIAYGHHSLLSPHDPSRRLNRLPNSRRCR